MASGHTFGCGSTSVLSHILVYWGGPFIGIYIGLKVNHQQLIEMWLTVQCVVGHRIKFVGMVSLMGFNLCLSLLMVKKKKMNFRSWKILKNRVNMHFGSVKDDSVSHSV